MSFAENTFQLKEMEAKLEGFDMRMNLVQVSIEMQTRFNNSVVKDCSKAKRRWL